MKKNFLGFLGMFVLCLCIASCSKSNGDLIKEYEKICEEVTEAYQNGDLNKVTSLAEKGEKIEMELTKRDLTDAEKTEVASITVKLATALSGEFTNQVNAIMEATSSWSGSSDDNEDNHADANNTNDNDDDDTMD